MCKLCDDDDKYGHEPHISPSELNVGLGSDIRHRHEIIADLIEARKMLYDVLEICRQWEPDNASGEHRNILAKAQSLLTPNVEVRGVA